MDNDDAIVGEILSRRQALLRAGAAWLGLLAGPSVMARLAGLGQTQRSRHDLYATPELTEGPFFVDEGLNRSNLLADTKHANVINGLPLLLQVVVSELTGEGAIPLKGAHVDVWHCNTAGAYSDEPRGMNPENTSGQHWLRGYQVSDGKGVVTFDTIYPGWYPGRATHIHFKVRTFASGGKSATHEFTSQWFFDEATNSKVYGADPYKSLRGERMPNGDDDIYSQRQADGSAAGKHLLLPVKNNPNGKGLIADFSMALAFR